LWRLLEQMTRTTPRRRTTLQFSQIRLTLVRTFMTLDRLAFNSLAQSKTRSPLARG
jgi:hypothetical protein